MLMRALKLTCGDAMQKAFSKQEIMMQSLRSAAEDVKSSKDSRRKAVLQEALNSLSFDLEDTPTPVPLSLGFEARGIDVENSSYFPSNSYPIKVAFSAGASPAAALPKDDVDVKEDTDETGLTSPTSSLLYTIYKIGDDLRQDQLTLQTIRIIDKLWLRAGMDLRIVTYACVPTSSDKEGMVEMVRQAETLREIQTAGGRGITGCFDHTVIGDWLAKHNPMPLEMEAALENFTRSCAGYCIISYVLGLCDRHNDNIMVKKTGHLFHIDFGKFLGDASG